MIRQKNNKKKSFRFLISDDSRIYSFYTIDNKNVCFNFNGKCHFVMFVVLFHNLLKNLK